MAKKETIQVKVTDAQKKLLKSIALEKHPNMSAYLMSLIEKDIEKRGLEELVKFLRS